jgi:hypothetical protein
MKLAVSSDPSPYPGKPDPARVATLPDGGLVENEITNPDVEATVLCAADEGVHVRHDVKARRKSRRVIAAWFGPSMLLILE